MQHKAAETKIKKLDSVKKQEEAVKVARVLELTREALTTLHSSELMHNFAYSEVSSFESIIIHLKQLHDDLTF